MRYCLGPPDAYAPIWAALAFMPFGLFFDFMDGKVARWRKKSSLMGQELDSLADLVRHQAFSARSLSPPFIVQNKGSSLNQVSDQEHSGSCASLTSLAHRRSRYELSQWQSLTFLRSDILWCLSCCMRFRIRPSKHTRHSPPLLLRPLWPYTSSPFQCYCRGVAQRCHW